jgi:hypothetical protein
LEEVVRGDALATGQLIQRERHAIQARNDDLEMGMELAVPGKRLALEFEEGLLLFGEQCQRGAELCEVRGRTALWRRRH